MSKGRATPKPHVPATCCAKSLWARHDSIRRINDDQLNLISRRTHPGHLSSQAVDLRERFSGRRVLTEHRRVARLIVAVGPHHSEG